MGTSKIEKKVLVKSVSTVILVCVIAAAAIGLALLFNAISGSALLGKIFLSLLTVFIAGLFLLNSINAITAGNKVGIFSAYMIIASAILFLLLIWVSQYFGSFSTIFNYIIVIVSMLSVLLNLIIGHYIVLSTKLLAVQVALYLCVAYVELALSFLILGSSVFFDNIWQVFAAAVIVAITLYVVLKVKEKNLAQTAREKAVKGSDEYITITKTEYENLKAEVERLRELVAEKPLTDGVAIDGNK